MMVRRSRLRTVDNRKRLLRVLLVVLAILVVVAGIGLIFRQQLLTLSEVWQETFSPDELPAESVRGTIYDRNFKELAQTLERVSLYARPREVKNLQETAGRLSAVLGMSGAELKQRLGRDSHLVWLRRDIDQEEEEEIHRLKLPGIYLHREFARRYPEQAVGAHFIGYAENDLGLAGIEHYYNHLLSRDHVRQEDIPDIDLKGEEQTGGYSHDLVLTVDMKIQAILDKYVAGLGEKLGRVQLGSLFLETGEGKVVAGGNYPSYNPNSIWRYENAVLENILFAPMVVPEEIRQFFRDASLLQGGWEQGTQIYPWSLVAGETDFARELRLWDRLQLTTELKVDLSDGKKQSRSLPEFLDCGPATDLGTVPKTAPPLKVLLGFTHLLNGGKKIQPHFLDRVLERPSQKEYLYNAFQGEVRGRKVLPALVSREMRTLLRAKGKPGILGSVSLSGEAVSRVAVADGFEYVRDRMSLVAIPAEQPEMILLLVSRQRGLGPMPVEDTEPGFLCKDIDSVLPSMVALQQVSQTLAGLVEAAEKKDENFQSEEPADGKKQKNLAGMLEEQSRLMPDLTGLSLRKGLRLLQDVEVEVHVEGSGRIVSQSPKVGEVLKMGTKCRLILKMDPLPQKTVQIRHLSKESNHE